MSEPTKRWQRIALLHPLLFATTPILLVAAANIDQVRPGLVLLPMAISLLGTLLLLLALWPVLRQPPRIAAMASLLLLLFFCEGHLHKAIWDLQWFGRSRHVHLMLLSLLLAAAVAGLLWLRRTKRDLGTLTQTLALASAALFVMGLGQMYLQYDPGDDGPLPLPSAQAVPTAGVSPPNEGGRKWPDIYYIILDGYARDDLLEEVYDHDNSAFTDYLREKGFYVAARSYSNYATTFLSLASSLNMRYVNAEAQRIGPDRRNRRPFYRLLRNHQVGRYLKSKGYRYVHYNTSWSGTETSDIADVRLALPGRLPEFYAVLASTTMLQPLISQGYVPGLGARLAGAEDHLFVLENVRQTPGRYASATFTFAHVLCPHPPYVFDRSGVAAEVGRREDLRGTEAWRNRRGYVDQLLYLNDRIKEVVDSLLEDSSVRPIIVIQADHGTCVRFRDDRPVAGQVDFVRERMAILSAYYVPAEVEDRLYAEISPVNTFRVILQALFDEDLPLLEDRQYVSWLDRPYDLVDVTDQLTTGQP